MWDRVKELADGLSLQPMEGDVDIGHDGNEADEGKGRQAREQTDKDKNGQKKFCHRARNDNKPPWEEGNLRDVIAHRFGNGGQDLGIGSDRGGKEPENSIAQFGFGRSP